jgi:glycosyltransferase involved in cell wall biosynthesis
LESGIPEDDIELIYNAVDIDEAAVKADPEWLRRRFSLPAEALVCTAVGRLVSAKNHEVLINAMKQAVARVPGLCCVIIGVGEYRARLEEQITKLGLEEHIRLPGYLEREEVLTIIKSSDIYVMPSRYEGTPIALLEAAALGRPILATFAGGIPELVSDQDHAILVKHDDADGMAAALVKLSQDRAFATDLGSRAQKHIREVFSLENQVQSTWKAYEKAWGRHPGHRYIY